MREAEAPQQPPQKPMQQQKLQKPAWITWCRAEGVPFIGAYFLFCAIGSHSTLQPADASQTVW